MARVEIPDVGNPNAASVALNHYLPEIGPAAVGFSIAVYANSRLSLRELEAARYRTSLINGCTACQGFRGARDIAGYVEGFGLSAENSPVNRGPSPDELFYELVPKWRTATIFSERERLAIEMAERMGEAPKSMERDEEFWSRLHTHFTDAEIVDMTFSIASWIGLGRATHALEFDAVCPTRF
jgi:alkylhydroperoxidase family enzyme